MNFAERVFRHLPCLTRGLHRAGLRSLPMMWRKTFANLRRKV
uniref:Uncharacterized protein n=1 Tax=Rhizophora mucronata TaxID=61149 RepID=A0A2P2K8B8_RHIMU